MVKKSEEVASGGKQLPQEDHLSQTILNSLSAHVAILDEQGFILATNLAWQQFAKANQIKIRPDTLDVNYLDICDKAVDLNAAEPSFAARGIRDVISGAKKEFAMEYPCHSLDRKRWFYMRVTRTNTPDSLRIVVSHENITALKLAEESIRRSEEELRREKYKLQEANTALRVLLHRVEDDKQQIQADVYDNMRQLVKPIVDQLAGQVRTARNQALLATLQARLSELARPYARRLSTLAAALTPQEMEVACLIREGRSSKEIADLLNLSLTTINFHRRNLRRKLDLRNTGANLRSFLTEHLK